MATQPIKNVWILLALGIITLALYIPAAKAGWVIDAAGFIYGLRHDTFWEFINRTHSEDQSFYQLFMLQYYVGYKLWGLNPWMWSLLYIALQSFNAFLLFIVCRNVLNDSGVRNGFALALCGALLFAVNPHVSEVVICKAYYHYLQSFFFILLIMLCTQKYQHAQQSRYAWCALLCFVLCAFTLEIFYLVPVIVLSIVVYYRFALGYDRGVMRKTILRFVVPQLILLVVYFVALYTTFKFLRPHKIEILSSAADYLSKPLKYIFHIVFLGRYFPAHVKDRVYSLCQSGAVLIIFYGLSAAVFLYFISRIKKMSGDGKALLLFLVWGTLTIAFVVPLAFPGSALLVFYDRYCYFACGFIYTALAVLVARMLGKTVAVALFGLYAVANLYFTVKLNTYWKHSAYTINRLLQDLPGAVGKTTLLLDIPENLNGVPMIGARPEGQYRHMRELFVNAPTPGNIYDVVSYNMIADNDGAHVSVLNDSTVRVTLNQWGTWWWFDGHGAGSYENNDYSVNMKDPGHMYELTIKNRPDKYLLLYSVGSAWKTVDMKLKNIDQY